MSTSIINHLSQKPLGLLYHYTTQHGLLGIIKNKHIWATSIHFLNDSLEFKHAFDLLQEEVNQRRQKADKIEGAFLDGIISYSSSASNLNIFVCSFSENGDLLSQWRAYAPNGTGYCLGFQYNDLASFIQEQKFILAKCIYVIDSQKDIIKSLLSNAVRNYVENKKRNINTTPDVHLGYFLGEFLRIAPIFKHDAYFQEIEWRLISPQITIDNAIVDFREGKSTIIPYFKFRLATEMEHIKLKEVVVGPNPQGWHATVPLAYLVMKDKIENCSVKLSRIPYRGW